MTDTEEKNVIAGKNDRNDTDNEEISSGDAKEKVSDEKESAERCSENADCEYDFKREQEQKRNKKYLCFAVISLIGGLFSGVGIFLAVPTLVCGIRAKKEERSQTVDWTIVLSAISVVLNLLTGVLFVLYFTSHFTPPSLPDPGEGEEGKLAAELIESVFAPNFYIRR